MKRLFMLLIPLSFWRWRDAWWRLTAITADYYGPRVAVVAPAPVVVVRP